ncbi:MAG: hypothetical protein R3C49_19720 [Planctomycetaceae bacterium]
MGNTEDVAEAHYVQEIKDFRKQAAETPTTEPQPTGESETNTDTKLKNPTRNPTRKRPQGKGNDTKPVLAPVPSAQKKTQRFPVSSGNSLGLVGTANCGQAEVDGNRTHQ